MIKEIKGKISLLTGHFTKLFILSLLTCFVISVNAQRNIDVLHYTFSIELSDVNDSIHCQADISFVAKEKSNAISFDLTGLNKGRGMEVTDIYYGQSTDPLVYSHSNNKINIKWPQELNKGDTARALIYYRGIPGDGLIISKNKYGGRTFFSDNWPDRAHQWLACKDDPADKATVQFLVTAPSHYSVVSNGLLEEKSELDKNKTLTRWNESVELPTKIMVIGVADFAIDTAGYVDGIPVTSWVFPENRKEGFYDFAQAKDILSFFINYIGPYPYEKLANVQSKTIFGGMENAGAIFYYENSVTGQRKDEALLAHEIVHQWFGDMATEKSFSHLWLSEGFATYLSNIYLESRYGKERLAKEMKEDRWQVISFAKNSDQPVVDTVSPYMQLLNANSYQKGGWILHMLRHQLGDSVFHLIIRKYYDVFKGKNADTKDFEKVCEQVSGKKQDKFFDQWLYKPGVPKLGIKWNYDSQKKKLFLDITQLQQELFDLTFEVEIQTSGGSQRKSFSISRRTEQFSIPLKEKPAKIIPDPDTSLLADFDIKK